MHKTDPIIMSNIALVTTEVITSTEITPAKTSHLGTNLPPDTTSPETAPPVQIFIAEIEPKFEIVNTSSTAEISSQETATYGPQNNRREITEIFQKSKDEEAANKSININNNKTTGFVRPHYIPPHLMGRDLNNPASDMIGTGRQVQKPRLGVKVPYRNLTSQIVSQDEIAQEILERSLRKYSYTDVPKGGDPFFAMKLTHRLANKITPERSEKKKNFAIISKKTIAAELKKTVIDAKKTKVTEWHTNSTNSSENSNTIPSKSCSQFPKQSEQENERAVHSTTLELCAQISSTFNEECEAPEPVATTSSSVCSTPGKEGNGLPPAEPELDNDSLLAILEGTGDVSDTSPTSVISLASSIATGTVPCAVLTPSYSTEKTIRRKKRSRHPLVDPNLEKELALKQLMDFERKKSEARLKRSMKHFKAEDQSSTADNTKHETDDKKPFKRATYSLGIAPKRFPKKYQRIIKRQIRNSKGKTKIYPPDQHTKKLPEVPEVQIAIDKFIKTYTNKRKQRPVTSTTSETLEKIHKKNTLTSEPLEKKSKKSTMTSKPLEKISKKSISTFNSPGAMPKRHEPQITEPTEVLEELPKTKEPLREDENCNEVDISDQEAKIDEEEEEEVVETKVNSKVMREINRLLGDEGAINMIYSIKDKRKVGKQELNHHSSLRRQKKDLLLKTKLVKNAVLRLSMESSQSSPHRARRSYKDSVKGSATSASQIRKESLESVDSNASERRSPKTIRKVAAEDSKIIRRHSSSSAYSSDEDESTSFKTMQVSCEVTSLPCTSSTADPFGDSSVEAETISKMSLNDVSDIQTISRDAAANIQKSAKDITDLKKILEDIADVEMNSKNGEKGAAVNSKADTEANMRSQEISDVEMISADVAETSKNDAVNKTVSNVVEVNLKNDTISVESITRNAKTRSKETENIEPCFGSNGVNESEPIVEKTIETVIPLTSISDFDAPTELLTFYEKQQSIAKQNEAKVTREIYEDIVSDKADIYDDSFPAKLCRETSLKGIILRKFGNLVHLVLAFSSSKMKNTLGVEALGALTDVLEKMRLDDSCKVVLVTSTGRSFCQGVDLMSLICSDESKRNNIVTQYVDALTSFVKCISQFPKLLIAGVHGSSVGLGVTMLPFFDMVFASDEATFHTPYMQLGQVPEAGATLTLPHSVGKAATTELLFGCHVLPAEKALQFGLITKLIKKEKFNEELFPLVRSTVTYSTQSVKATKQLLRQSLNSNLQELLDTEGKLLHENWCSEECQNRIKTFIEQDAFFSSGTLT